MLIRRGLRGGYTSASTHLYEFSHYVQLFASNLVWTTQTQFTACSKRFCIYSWCHIFFPKCSSNTGTSSALIAEPPVGLRHFTL